MRFFSKSSASAAKDSPSETTREEIPTPIYSQFSRTATPVSRGTTPGSRPASRAASIPFRSKAVSIMKKDGVISEDPRADMAPTPKWVQVIRIAQLCVALVVVALCGYGVYWLKFNGDTLMLFAKEKAKRKTNTLSPPGHRRRPHHLLQQPRQQQPPSTAQPLGAAHAGANRGTPLGRGVPTARDRGSRVQQSDDVPLRVLLGRGLLLQGPDGHGKAGDGDDQGVSRLYDGGGGAGRAGIGLNSVLFSITLVVMARNLRRQQGAGGAAVVVEKKLPLKSAMKAPRS
ncbi:hypothetical protein BP6252_06620 [Coleophoma cylindrospora]|uniref:Uncharacterized protein n=1 Tax=Coleophoma cylindrospora TaxID=1849047 RepID=A0A3D8RNF3_9HELO|nr:hypothetical protein BP6252_06620 [Coleophoma cylindrospora]